MDKDLFVPKKGVLHYWGKAIEWVFTVFALLICTGFALFLLYMGGFFLWSVVVAIWKWLRI